ncbi:MAG: hypothetical protein ACR2F6_13180 [Mycobacteriales bacterium]
MSRIANAGGLELHSAFWLNLHHILYAEAWSRRGATARPGAQALPHPVMLPDVSVEWYDAHVADRDLLFDDGMSELHWALAKGELTELGDEHRCALEDAAPSYRDTALPDHDAVNRSWAADAAQLVADLAADVIPLLEQWYGEPWPTDPVRVDVVWVCNWEGAYTVLQPAPHVIASSTNDRQQGDAAAEILFHEMSHLLIASLRNELRGTQGLWHAVLFYLTGEAVRRALTRLGTDYIPYLFSTGLIDRAWPQYRELLTTTWRDYSDGAITRNEAVRAQQSPLAVILRCLGRLTFELLGVSTLLEHGRRSRAFHRIRQRGRCGIPAARSAE